MRIGFEECGLVLRGMRIGFGRNRKGYAADQARCAVCHLVFVQECLVKWLARKMACPLCQQDPREAEIMSM